MSSVGPQIVAYHARSWHRLGWEQVKTKYPTPEYWIVSYRGKHVGEFFGGKSGWWYGIIFGRLTIRKRDKDYVLHTLAACITGPKQ